MKTITIKQPWATLIAEGIKSYEFRSWKTNYRGKLLIHAGLSLEKNSLERFKKLGLTYPLGKIIAVVDLVDCIKIDDEFNKKIIGEKNIAYGDKERTGYAWKISNVKKIEYKDVKGSLGLWNYDIDEKNL